MKAMIIKENGGPEKFIPYDIPQPDIGDNEVLVRVKAISINPVDTAVRQSKQVMTKIMKIDREQDFYIPGWDISGTIVNAGNSTFSAGKEVFGMINFPGQGKAYAEMVAASVDHLAEKPSNISHEEAAGATLAALTAWQALVTHGNIKNGDKVLVHGASGGVGHFAIQIAKNFGAHVIAVASGSSREFVMKLGADQFIDYQAERFEKIIADADLVLDSVNDRNNLWRSIEVCRKGGKLISIKYYFDDELMNKARQKDLYAIRMMVASNGKDMESIATLLASGKMKSNVASTFPFERLADAHKQVENGKNRGKVIVTL